MEKQLTNKSLEGLKETANSIISFAGSLKIWLFYGEMGAGKTTLIKEISKLMGVQENVSSPTYSLVNEYENEKGETIYHFDFYRIRNEGEILDIGYEEYFFSGRHCFIEWPEKIPNFIPDTYLKVEIKTLENNSRLILLSKHE